MKNKNEKNKISQLFKQICILGDIYFLNILSQFRFGSA